MQVSHGLEWGVVYAVIGEKYFAEASTSVKSLMEHHPDAPIDILTFGKQNAVLRSMFPAAANLRIVDCADYVRKLGIDVEDAHAVSRALKVGTILLSRFPVSLFLDSDTYIKGSVESLLAPLLAGSDPIDLIVTNEPDAAHEVKGADNRPVATILSALSKEGSYNSGVFAYSQRLQETGFAKAWVDDWVKQVNSTFVHDWGRLSDQRSFNKIIRQLQPRLRAMTNTIWNAQCKILWELYNGGHWDEIKIVHCKLVHRLGPDPEALCADPYTRRFRLAK